MMARKTSSPRHNNYHNNFLAFSGGGFLLGFATSSFLWLLVVVHVRPPPRLSIPPLCPDGGLGLNRKIRNTNNNTNPIDDGWKQINIFYGDRDHISNASTIPDGYFRANQWFSQYRQDEVVIHLLKEKRMGYFVDLASNDAIRISNTYALETYYQWTGLCLEPNPIYWNSLSHRKCEVVAAVVGNETMKEVSFRFPKSKATKGGIMGDRFDNGIIEANNMDEARLQYTVGLTDLLDRFHAPNVIDYFSLDVEGAEEFILQSFAFDKYRFNILTLERPTPALSSLLDTNGYVLLKTLKSGGSRPKETLWAHSSILSSLDMSGLTLNTQNYKYRENVPQRRIAPVELNSNDRLE